MGRASFRVARTGSVGNNMAAQAVRRVLSGTASANIADFTKRFSPDVELAKPEGGQKYLPVEGQK